MKNLRSIVLTFLGIIGVFATILTNTDPWKTVLFLVFFFLIFLGIVSFCIDALVPSIKVWNLGKSASQLGIAHIHPKGNSGSKMSENIRNAKSIRIFSATGIVFVRTYKNELTEALSNNCLIRQMMVKLGSPFIFESEQAESKYRIGQFNDEFKQVEGILKECIDNSKKINKNNTGKVEIGYFNTQVRLPIIICDDNYGWVTLVLSPKRSSESVSLELINRKNGFLDDCINHFENIWTILQDSNDTKIL